MKFRVIDCCYEDASGVPANGADFLLEEDSWNDYGYYTLYHLHATHSITGNGNENVGYLRVMKIDQQEGEWNLLRKLYKTGIFESLPDNFVSLSSGVSTWRGIERLLSHDQIRVLVKSLNIITSDKDVLYSKVKDHPCFTKSLLRETSMDDYGLKLAREIIANKGRMYDLVAKPMTFKLPLSEKSIPLNFSTGNQKLDNIKDVPSRLLAFIGNNGVGKSTMLYRLIKILYSSPDVRSLYKDKFGEVTPTDVGFSRLFMVSYSALDNFTLPGMTLSEVRDILAGMDGEYGRLVFCGLRDVKTEYKEFLEIAKQKNEENPTYGLVDTEHVQEIKLKSVSSLADEFSDSLEQIRLNKSKHVFWNGRMNDFALFNDGFKDFIWEDYEYRSKEKLIEMFLRQSTGLKFILHSLAIIIDNIEWNSIILFDEPENHLQPPLLSKLLNTLRLIAHDNASLIMVATHSPVILQETFSQNVVIVSRSGDKFSSRNPEIETYGENIGAITNEVFGLNSSITSYFDVADKMYDEGWFANKKNLNKVGSEIRAYLAAKS